MWHTRRSSSAANLRRDVALTSVAPSSRRGPSPASSSSAYSQRLASSSDASSEDGQVLRERIEREHPVPLIIYRSYCRARNPRNEVPGTVGYPVSVGPDISGTSGATQRVLVGIAKRKQSVTAYPRRCRAAADFVIRERTVGIRDS